MISSIASRPLYTPNPLRTGVSSRSLPQSSLRFGHSHEHVHADGSTCKDKHCTEGKKGERQFFLQPFFDWVKATWQKFKDFVSRLSGKSKPQASNTTSASAPAAPTPASADKPAPASHNHHHDGAGHHKHSADGQCCGKKHSHSH